MAAKITQLPVMTGTAGPFVENHALPNAQQGVCVTVNLSSLSGDIFQLPLSEEGVKALIHTLASLDMARKAFGSAPVGGEPRLQ